MHSTIPLCDLCQGQKGKICKIAIDGPLKRRILDLGLIQNTEVEALGRSPSGDPVAYLFRGAVIAFRAEEASKIFVNVV